MNLPVEVASLLRAELLFAIFVMSMATLRVTKIIVEEEIFRPVREFIWKKFPPERSLFGYAFTCVSCISFWVGLIFFAAFILFPFVTIVVSILLTISAIVVIINDFLNR